GYPGPWRANGLAPRECFDMLLLGRDRDDQASFQADRIEAQQVSVRVDDRAAARPAWQPRSVLDASGDPPAPPASEAAVRGRNEADRHPEPPTPRIGQAQNRAA